MALEQDFIYYRAWAKRIMEAANGINLDDAITVCEFASKEFSREFTMEEGQTVLTIIENWKVGKATYPPGYDPDAALKAIDQADKTERAVARIRAMSPEEFKKLSDWVDSLPEPDTKQS